MLKSEYRYLQHNSTICIPKWMRTQLELTPTTELKITLTEDRKIVIEKVEGEKV